MTISNYENVEDKDYVKHGISPRLPSHLSSLDWPSCGEGSRLELSARAARVASGANTPTRSVQHLLLIRKFYHAISAQSTSLNALASDAEEILNILELAFFHAILKPTEIISDEMPDGVSRVSQNV